VEVEVEVVEAEAAAEAEVLLGKPGLEETALGVRGVSLRNHHQASRYRRC
jgi:hypothetical protein